MYHNYYNNQKINKELIIFKDNVNLLLTKYDKNDIVELEISKYKKCYRKEFIKVDELDSFCNKYKDDIKKY